MIVSDSAIAQETQPGDACVVGEYGWVRNSTGNDGGGGYWGDSMICDGTNWVGFLHYEKTGYVGIGTTSPSSILHISGGNVFIDGNDFYNRELHIGHSTTEAGNPAALHIDTGSVQDTSIIIGSFTDASVDGGVYNLTDRNFLLNRKGLYSLDGLRTDGEIYLDAGEFKISAAGSNSSSCIRFSSATTKMQYSHDCSAYSDMGSGVASAAGNDGEIQFNSNGSLGTKSTFFWDDVNGRLGIGTASPSAELEVVADNVGINEDILLKGSNYPTMVIESTNANGGNLELKSDTKTWGFYVQGNNFTLEENDAIDRVTVVPGGYVGIGTTSPSGILHTSGGNVFIDGSVLGQRSLTIGNTAVPNAALHVDTGDILDTAIAVGSFAETSIAGGSWNLNDNGWIQTGKRIYSLDGMRTDGDVYIDAGEFKISAAGSNSSSCIRFSSATTKMQYSHDCSAYSDMGSSAAAGNDGEIQFNSNGSLGTKSTFFWDDVNGRLGIGTVSPAVALDVVGAIKIDYDATACAVGIQGTIRFDSAGDVLNYCDGTTWQTIANSGGTAINDLSDAYTIYDAGTTSNFIMGRTGAAALTAGAVQNLFIGELAGATTTNSTANTDNNTAVGYSALAALTSGGFNTALGHSALAVLTTSGSNTAVGYSALAALTSGGFNTVLGREAMGSSTAGNFNTAIGYQALNSGTGSNNVATGYSALSSNTSGSSNTASGFSTMSANTSGGSNTAMGRQAMAANTSGSKNTAIGYLSLNTNKAKSNSTAVGYYAMRYADNTVTAGNANNTAVGYEALRGSTLSTNNTGVDNTALGYNALRGMTSGGTNVAIGSLAGNSITTGAGNIVIGYNVDTLTATTSNWLNIGDVIYSSGLYNATAHVGIMNSSPNVELDVTGDIEYTGTIADMSDRRLKSNIEALGSGHLEKVTALQGVSFQMKDDLKNVTEYGFIAQDVQQIYPLLINEHSDSMLSMNYVGLIAPMVEAIKEQHAVINDQQSQIDTQQTQIDGLIARIEAIEASE